MTRLWCNIFASSQYVVCVELKRFEALVVRLRLKQVFAGRLLYGKTLKGHDVCAGGERSMVKPGLRG